MDRASAATRRGVPRSGIGLAAVRIAFGLIWAVDASLKWSPSFVVHFTGYLDDATAGQPHAVRAWLHGWIAVVGAHPQVFARIVAVTESLVALFLILGLFTNVVCVLGGLLSLAIWSTAEGFGGPYGPGTTDVGASIVYVLLFGALACTGAGAVFGLDGALGVRLRRLRWMCSASQARRVAVSKPRARRASVGLVAAASAVAVFFGMTTAFGPTAPASSGDMTVDGPVMTNSTPAGSGDHMPSGGQDAMDPGGQGNIVQH